MENIFYTYIHRRVSDNQVFYVGKGKGCRASSKANRNKHWNHVVKKHGFTVQIIDDGLSEKDAFSKEKDAIEVLRGLGCNLVNLTDGGDGISGYVYSEDAKKQMSFLKTAYFSNLEARKEQSDRRKDYFANPSARKAQSEKIKAYFSNQENRKAQSERTSKFFANNPNAAQANSDRKKQYFANYDNRILQSERLKSYYAQNPLAVEKMKLNKSNQHFIHVESGKEFSSYCEAARVLGFFPTSIRRWVKAEKGFKNLKDKNDTCKN